MRKHWTYWYNTYAPWRIVRKHIAHFIYKWADKKYGAGKDVTKVALLDEI